MTFEMGGALIVPWNNSRTLDRRVHTFICPSVGSKYKQKHSHLPISDLARFVSDILREYSGNTLATYEDIYASFTHIKKKTEEFCASRSKMLFNFSKIFYLIYVLPKADRRQRFQTDN